MYSQGQNFNNQFSMQPQDMSGMQGNMPGAAMPMQSEKKKLNLPWILVIAEAAIILILGIILVLPKGNNRGASIADDKTEDVSLNTSGNVESFSALCETPEYYISFDKDNRYYIERKLVPQTIAEDDEFEENWDENSEESSSFVDLFYEKGTYTVDGFDIRMKPQGGENYYSSYKSHQLTYKELKYDCQNQE